MSAHLIIMGEVLATPVFKEQGNGGLAASLKVKATRYDHGKKARVADPYTLFFYGAGAQKLRDENIGESDVIAAQCSVEVDKDGICVFTARKFSRAGDEGFESHFVMGAVEHGKASSFLRKSDQTEGNSANFSVRLPYTKQDGSEGNRFVRMSAWDGRARAVEKGCVLDRDSQEERTWLFFSGVPRSESYTANDGEQKRIEKTTVETLDFTNVKTLPHVSDFGGTRTEEGHEAKSQDFGAWTPPPPDYDHDDDILF